MLQINFKQEIEKEHSCFKYDFVLNYILLYPSMCASHEPQARDLALSFKELEWLGVPFLCLLFYDELFLLWKIAESRHCLRIRAQPSSNTIVP